MATNQSAFRRPLGEAAWETAFGTESRLRELRQDGAAVPLVCCSCGPPYWVWLLSGPVSRVSKLLRQCPMGIIRCPSTANTTTTRILTTRRHQGRTTTNPVTALMASTFSRTCRQSCPLILRRPTRANPSRALPRGSRRLPPGFQVRPALSCLGSHTPRHNDTGASARPTSPSAFDSEIDFSRVELPRPMRCGARPINP